MKYLDNIYYVEVKDHRYRIHPSGNIILQKRDEPKSLRTQYQVQKINQVRKNRKIVENNGKLEVKNYPKNKKQPITQQQSRLPECLSCKRNNWLEFDKGWYCKNCEYNINKQKHQIVKKSRRQNLYFSTRLSYANKKIRETSINMVNTKYNSTEDMINNLQSLGGKIKLKFYKIRSKYYDEKKNRNFQTREDPFSKNAQGISKTYHEVLLVLKLLQIRPQFENM